MPGVRGEIRMTLVYDLQNKQARTRLVLLVQSSERQTIRTTTTHISGFSLRLLNARPSGPFSSSSTIPFAITMRIGRLLPERTLHSSRMSLVRNASASLYQDIISLIGSGRRDYYSKSRSQVLLGFLTDIPIQGHGIMEFRQSVTGRAIL